MEIKALERIRDFVFNDERIKVYKTLQNPQTMKEYVICEIYTNRGTMDYGNQNGKSFDKKA